MSSAEYDVVMATDCRFPGGTTASVVEEIEAQYRAGYRTGLLHLPSPVQRSGGPFAQRIRRVLKDGKAELIAGSHTVRTPLLNIRNPSVVSEVPVGRPPIEADHVLMVANQVPSDDRAAAPYYDPQQIHRNVATTFGRDPIWAPIGPPVRTALAPSGVPMQDADWENILDLAAWHTPRTGFVSDRPVIGRHSRGHWSKWPATRADLLAAYPADDRYRVHIMGGTEAPESLLGHLPRNWHTLPFDALPVPQFLAGIDFFVYFHHPGLVEAFGRVVLEALASGAVCVAPPELEPIFGDACFYGTPDQVRPFIDGLYVDQEAFLQRSARGVELVRNRFSYEAHIARTGAIIGPPDGEPQQIHPQQPPAEPTVVLATGALGPQVAHVQDQEGTTAQLVLLRSAADVAHPGQHDNGVLVETVPAVVAGQSRPAQEVDLRRRLAHLVRAHRAKRLLVLDPAGIRHTGDIDDDVDIQVRTGTGTAPGEYVPTAPSPPAAGRRRPPRAVLRRWWRKTLSLARHRGPKWVRRSGRAVLDAAGRVQRGVAGYAGVNNPTSVPVAAHYPHVSARAPVVLAVITGADVAADRTLDALLARAQTASVFRFAVLGPPSWIEPAAVRGVTLETWVPRSAWPSTYTARWPEYARERVTEVSRWIRPVAVVNIDQTIDPGTNPASGHVLDLIEAAARARQ